MGVNLVGVKAVFQPKPTRALAALAAALVLGVAGCATPQTLIPYNQAEGVTMSESVDGTTVPLKIGNLLLVTTGKTDGFIAGTLVSPQQDKLVEVAGNPFHDGEGAGQPFDSARPNVTLPKYKMVNLLDSNLTVSSPDLMAGYTAELTLTFEKAGQIKVTVPVVDGDKADYESYRPEAPEPAAPSAAPKPGAPTGAPTAGTPTQPANAQPTP